MPYIKPGQRERLEPAIQALVETIQKVSRDYDGAGWPGVFHYSITNLLLRILPELRYSAPERRYSAIATATGVLHNVLDEFYRRYAAPYEDEQAAANGDIFPPCLGMEKRELL